MREVREGYMVEAGGWPFPLPQSWAPAEYMFFTTGFGSTLGWISSTVALLWGEEGKSCHSSWSLYKGCLLNEPIPQSLAFQINNWASAADTHKRTATNGATVSESKYSGPGRSEVSANEHSSSSAFLSRICAAKGTKNVSALLTQEGTILTLPYSWQKWW